MLCYAMLCYVVAAIALGRTRRGEHHVIVAPLPLDARLAVAERKRRPAVGAGTAPLAHARHVVLQVHLA